MRYAYHLVDVFTAEPLSGNALAVFVDASGMDDRTMQRVAREMNQSETAFVLPGQSRPESTRVRIFTPTYEMEFAG
ncbi:MAG TPA: PhzF family phenazine biosynthesis isomerase, partial [Candidatus Aquilonibacter sp.]|nr:PhzF family phenazine biosynthesis isomerase [Candidatus Aquilonibacter sp.]